MKIIQYEDKKFLTFHYDIILTKFEIITSNEKLNPIDKMSDILLTLSKIAKELEDKEKHLSTFKPNRI